MKPHLLIKINFFRLCRIVLEDIPGALRTVFRDEIANKYRKEWRDDAGCGQWLLQKERFKLRLSNTQQRLLGSGRVDDWDVTLLVHALLHSSELLLADSFRDNQANLKHNDSSKLVSVSHRADFTKYLSQGNIILCDTGQELCRNEVKSVRPMEVLLKYPIKVQNPSQISLYKCSQDWLAVEDLSIIRNSRFAHCKNARIDIAALKDVVRRVKILYSKLRIGRQRINSMESILTESYSDDVTLGKIQEYQDKWHAEISNYVKVKEDIGHLYFDVEDLRKILKDIEKDSKDRQDDLVMQKKDITVLQSDFVLTSKNVSELQANQQLMEQKTSDMSSHLASLKSKQISIEEQHSSDIIAVTEQQAKIDGRISHAVELIKQVSDDQKDHGEKIVSLVETERQLSKEMEKTGKFVHQLSAKDDEMKDEIEGLKDDVADIKSDMIKVKSEIVEIKGPLSKFTVSHFESDISYYSDQYHAGTRQWLFDDIDSWKQRVLSNRNLPNMCLITANPGMGKSVLAAKLCTIYKETGVLGGCFFFQHHLGRRSSPKILVQSLCHQFQSTIPGYSKLIENDVAKLDPEQSTVFELFSYLIKEPLSRLQGDMENWVIVIDALDECDYDSGSDLLKLLIRDFIKLPRWIQIILTARPDKKILHSLKRIKSIIEINPEDPRNLSDIRLFLMDFLSMKMSNDEISSGIELLVKKSEGMFLYFHYAIDTLEDKEHVSLEELKHLLPDGIDDYYELNFSRLYGSLGKNKYQIFLQCVLVARSDFPQDLMKPLLEIESEEAKKVLSTISILFPIHNGSICIFHKSLKDWLLDKDLAGKYAVDPLAGHRHLSSLCIAQLKDLKSKFFMLSFSNFTSSPVYRFVVENAVYHTCHVSLSQVLNIVEDLQFMFFRLIFSHGVSSGLLEDISEAITLAAEGSLKIHQALHNCFDFVRRHSHDLEGNPSLIFQCALNEPTTFSRCLGISQFLADPLRAFPGLKVLLQIENKSEQFITPLMTFSAEDQITSCALSPCSKFVIFSDCRDLYYD